MNTVMSEYNQPSRRAIEPIATELARSDRDQLLARYARNRAPLLRDRVVLSHQNLVRYLAGKFANRGEPLEDLIQVGTIGLINAIDRYDPGRGLKFTTFATPTIVGEIQRYFRDKAWSLKVPRSIKELNMTAARAQDALSSKLGRSPTVGEVAQAIGASEEITLEAMELGKMYDTVSLDSAAPGDGDNNPMSLAELVGAEDEGLQALSAYADLDEAIVCLNPRERAVIVHYYLNDMPQTEVAKRLNISQMHVSRLQKQALEKLKTTMNADAV